MPLIDAIHIVGSSIYFVYFVLFIWLNRFPRIHSCAAWWALAMLFQLLGRASFLVLPIDADPSLVEVLYTLFVVGEKLFLLIGLHKLFDRPGPAFWFRVLAAVTTVWILVTWWWQATTEVFAVGVALFNATALIYVAVVAYRHRAEVPHRMMVFTAIVSCLFAFHWLYYPLLRFDQGWEIPGFTLGMLYAALMYLTLIGALLLLFQKRLMDAEEQALALAYEDPLTGLNNQRYMSKLFEEALLLATRPHQMVALLYIDLDNFKPINDSAGHKVGDEVLRIVAKRLREHTRSTDICARIGGDEFVVIATQLEHEKDIHEIADKLLDQLTTPIRVGGVGYQVGASMGVALYPMNGMSLNNLMEKADAAMYQVKKEGKSGYRIHSN